MEDTLLYERRWLQARLVTTCKKCTRKDTG